MTYDAYIYNPDLDSATSKAFALLLLKCSSMIYLVIMIYHCFLTYQMFHLIKKPKKDEPKQQMKQKVSNPEKANATNLSVMRSTVYEQLAIKHWTSVFLQIAPRRCLA